MGFGQVCMEVWEGMVSEERDRQVRWGDWGFTCPLIGHVSSYGKTST